MNRRVDLELSAEDVLELTRREIAEIPYERVYYTLKMMRFKPLFPQTVEMMRLCLAVHRLGLRVTAFLIATLRDCTKENALTSLHILGDKKCLTLLRGSKEPWFQWIVSPDFLQHYGEQGYVESAEEKDSKWIEKKAAQPTIEPLRNHIKFKGGTLDG